LDARRPGSWEDKRQINTWRKAQGIRHRDQSLKGRVLCEIGKLKVRSERRKVKGVKDQGSKEYNRHSEARKLGGNGNRKDEGGRQRNWEFGMRNSEGRTKNVTKAGRPGRWEATELGIRNLECGK